MKQTIVLALAGSLALLAGCSKKEPAIETAASVQVATAQIGDIAPIVEAEAVLNPAAQAAIAPKISAPVRKFYVQRGAKVKEGQLLAVLENRDLTAAQLDNQGSLSAAQATYATATKAQVPEDYQKAELDLAQARANLELNQEILKSRKQLLAEGAIPGRDVDTAQAAMVQAQAAFDVAQQHLEGQKSVTREAALKAASGQLESAKGKYEGAAAMVYYSEIRSPITGVVTDRPLFAGEMAAAGSALVTVMDTRALIAKVHLPQVLVARLAVGSPAEVNVTGLDEPLKGKISLISPAVDQGSTTVEVWVRLENPDGKLRPGTPVHVSMEATPVKGAVTIPQTALLRSDDGSQYVMTVKGDTAHKQPVVIGVRDESRVQIVSGITSGVTVIATGAFGLDEGAKVQVGSDKGDAEKPDAGKEESGK